MNELTRSYNKLVETMNDLIDLGININAFHSNVEGFGFYAEKNKNEYVKVSIFYSGDITFYVTKYKHNSKYAHDILNDITLNKINTTDYTKVKQLVLERI